MHTMQLNATQVNTPNNLPKHDWNIQSNTVKLKFKLNINVFFKLFTLNLCFQV